MQTLNQSLYSLYARRLFTLEEAMGRSTDVEELRSMIEGRVGGGAAGSAHRA
jgi:twitching motility protein PilT